MPGVGTSDSLQVCIIGAGFSGICAAIQLEQQLGIRSFTLFESNDDVGGTWLVNRYPGCACDIPSHLYSYSFEKNPNWSSNYASQPEILEYIRGVAGKHDLYSRIRFGTEVKCLKWEEELKKWRVTFQDRYKPLVKEMLFDVVINGCGQLRIPNIPQEFLSFQGDIMHSAEWNSDISLRDKNVAVVGSGASAIQLIPAIAPRVKSLHLYHRKPAWVLPKVEFDIPKILQQIFDLIPITMWIFRMVLFCIYELMVVYYRHESIFNRFGAWHAENYRNGVLHGRKDLIPKVIPNYVYGCKRLLLSNDYYQALVRPNVKVSSGPIAEVREDCIVTRDGEANKIDVLILATGFKAQDYFAPMEIIGKNGVNILEQWRHQGPSIYYGVMCSDAPNLFTMVGPNSFLGHNSVIFQIECQANFTMSLISQLISRKQKSIAVKSDVEIQFMSKLRKSMKKTVWGNAECGSWHSNARGEITTLWPQTCISFWHETRTVDIDNFNFS